MSARLISIKIWDELRGREREREGDKKDTEGERETEREARERERERVSVLSERVRVTQWQIEQYTCKIFTNLSG